MVSGVIVTHGKLAEALLEAAELIVGRFENVVPVCLAPDDGMRLCVSRVHDAIDAVDQGDGVVILADLPGGTPVNAGLECLADRQVEVVTGVNLSMVVKLHGILRKNLPVDATAAALADSGRRSVRVATEGLRKA